MHDGLTIHLIRHEKTAANLAGQYIGRTDQSIVTRPALQFPFVPAGVFVSELKRTQETARLYFPDRPFFVDSRFNEIDFGEFELKTYEELRDNELYRAWINNPMEVTPPGGESFNHFAWRVRMAYTDYIQYNMPFTFVLHGGVMRLLLADALHKPFQEVQALHRTIYTLHWDDVQQFKERKKCTSYSEVFLTERKRM